MSTHSNILAWEIPCLEETEAIVHGIATELDMTQQLNHHHNGNKSLVSQITCKYFLRYVGCLFILLMVSFAMQKLLSFQFLFVHFFFFFISITLGDVSKKILLQFMSKNVLTVFSSRSFLVPVAYYIQIFKFGFIFVYGFRECPNHSFTCSCPVFTE